MYTVQHAEPQGKPKNTGVGSLSLLGVLLDPGIKPGSPALAGRFLTTAPPGKRSLVWNHFCDTPQKVPEHS